MRILITGGAGCLGSNLIEHFVPLGHEVFVLDNFATGNREVLPDVAGLSWREGDVADKQTVAEVFAEFEPSHVIHAAAAYKDPHDYLEDARTNVTGSILVAEQCRERGVKRLINLQTALIYGRPDQVPIAVDHPMRPFTSYGISKASGEMYMRLACGGVPFVSLRLANITGPRLAIGPIPTFYQRLKAGKVCFCSDTVRDFLDMSDFMSLMETVLADDAPAGNFNISTGDGHTIKDVFDVVCRYLNIELEEEVPIVPAGDDDVPAVVLDASMAREVLAWEAKVGFTETLEKMLRWYDEYGINQIYSHLAAPPVKK